MEEMKRAILMKTVFSSAALILLWLVLRNFPFKACLSFIQELNPAVILLLLAFSASAFLLMGVRWFLLLRYFGLRIGFGAVTGARLISFFWSYITPGSHVGGEYHQIRALRLTEDQNPAAVGALVLDKGTEILGNFLTVLIVIAIFPGSGFRWTAALAVLPVSAVLMIALYKGFPREKLPKGLKKWMIPLRQFLKKKSNGGVITVLLISSVISPLLMVVEFFLFFYLTGQGISVLSAFLLSGSVKLSLYTPVPGGAGFFESAVLGVSRLRSLSAEAAGAYVLYSRIRDLLQLSTGGIVWIWRKQKKPS